MRISKTVHIAHSYKYLTKNYVIYLNRPYLYNEILGYKYNMWVLIVEKQHF